ncbi:hypothetical protein [Paraburkholderia caledonica]|uniref:Uncharacterized protein n=1 Tax=Paraburkholderia caledonica TaxID=134536 RepID=A0AB73INX8_9BURK|nr:hypothetical protein [Paraburkholderia caledonica]
MHIDESLNAVFPVVTERITKKVEGKDVHEDIVTVWAYHSPISRAVFDANYRTLAATKAAMSSKGPHYLMSAGPRIAALTFRDEGVRDAEARGKFDDEGNPKDDDVTAFFAEIKRLTTILCPGQNGWDMLPVDAAIAGGRIDKEDWEEVESAIVFFCCHWSMAKKSDRKRIAQATASLLSASITPSPLSEYVGSLQKLTPGATSAKPAASLVPS